MRLALSLPAAFGIGLSAALIVSLPAAGAIHMTHVGTYETGTFNGGASEIAAYDPATQRLFVVNASLRRVDILSIADPAAPELVGSIDVTPYGESANSVDTHDGIVAVAIQAVNHQANGRIAFFDADGTPLADFEAGALPDMITFTPDGTKVLCANEGEPNDSYTVDPLGTVTLVDLSNGLGNAVASTLDFTDFDGQPIDPLIRIYGVGADVSQDLEPEYVAVSPDSRTAWVTLQENNAIAILDLTTNTFTNLVALGYKDHSLAGNGLDASDQSGAINIATWPVHGMYQPDAMVAFEASGEVYLVTANEGDARAYGGLNEEARVSQLNLDDTVFPNEAVLKQNTNIGRLRVTNRTGDIDSDGDFDVLHPFGARSFTIWDAEGDLVWDSGQLLEEITAAAYPEDFNSNNDSNNSFKSRSDDKGPEPEGVTVASILGRIYAFVCLERVGGVAVFDVSVPNAPMFIEYVNHRNFDGTPGQPSALDLGPEGVFFISATDSPIGVDLIVTANEISGTTSVFRVEAPVSSTDDPTEVSGRQSVQVWPNPSSAGQGVFFSGLGRQATVTVHDASGRKLANMSTNDDGGKAAWSGNGAEGRPLPAGVYYARIETGPEIVVRKIVLR